ncbi:BolA-like protein [Coemansia sp. RSA 2610]|nr:BolA-like protein [Coemansia sp. RSA 2610]
MDTVADAIKKKLLEEFPDAKYELVDESGGCGDIYRLVLASDGFKGLKPLAKHRKVNTLLRDEIKRMHAFSQKTYTLDEYEALAAQQQQQQQHQSGGDNAAPEAMPATNREESQ